jgi:hypothetical protein
MSDNIKNISPHINFYLNEIKYIDQEINYWKFENQLKSSINIQMLIEKLEQELVKLKYTYSKFLDEIEKK